MISERLIRVSATFCSDHQSPITSLDVQPLGLCSRVQFGRNRADDKRFKAKLEENGANFANAQSRFIKLEVNDIVICIHLVTQAGYLHELPIEFQDVPHFAQAARINLNFKHDAPDSNDPVAAMQSISHEKLIAGPRSCELAIARSAKLRK